MAKLFSFWTNGIATVLEDPGLAKLVLQRTDLGTVVEQDANTAAWLHIPITTPTIMEDDGTIYLRKVGLRAKVNENAKLDRIHIRRGIDLIIDLDVNYTNTTIEKVWDVSDVEMGHHGQAGLAMSIQIQFLTGTPRGRVEVQCAGASFS